MAPVLLLLFFVIPLALVRMVNFVDLFLFFFAMLVLSCRVRAALERGDRPRPKKPAEEEGLALSTRGKHFSGATDPGQKTGGGGGTRALH